MPVINRRRLLQGLGIALGAAAQQPTSHALARVAGESTTQQNSSEQRLALVDYEPKSMLYAQETRIERAKFPVIDVHTHISVSANS
jgi:hypothetical protein